MEKPADLAFHIGFVAALLKAAREQHLAQQPFFVSDVHGAPCVSKGGPECRSGQVKGNQPVDAGIAMAGCRNTFMRHGRASNSGSNRWCAACTLHLSPALARTRFNSLPAGTFGPPGRGDATGVGRAAVPERDQARYDLCFAQSGQGEPGRPLLQKRPEINAEQQDFSAMQLTLRRPDDWHLHLRDGAAHARRCCRTARGQFAPRHRHAQPAPAGDHHGGRRWPTASASWRRCRPATAFRAADDAVPDRQHHRGGDRAAPGERRRCMR